MPGYLATTKLIADGTHTTCDVYSYENPEPVAGTAGSASSPRATEDNSDWEGFQRFMDSCVNHFKRKTPATKNWSKEEKLSFSDMCK